MKTCIRPTTTATALQSIRPGRNKQAAAVEEDSAVVVRLRMAVEVLEGLADAAADSEDRLRMGHLREGHLRMAPRNGAPRRTAVAGSLADCPSCAVAPGITPQLMFAFRHDTAITDRH